MGKTPRFLAAATFEVVTGDSPPTSPVFATATPAAILAAMPTLEINATQPWLISQADSVAAVDGLRTLLTADDADDADKK